MSVEKGGELAGPNPVDRGKLGSRLHNPSNRVGLRLVVGVSTGSCRDNRCLRPLVEALLNSKTGTEEDHGGAELLAGRAWNNPSLRRIGVLNARKRSQHPLGDSANIAGSSNARCPG
ncbi:hypothetical protein GCM10023205_53250 [Yinghuangia aomiensis]|uniref:Uncharacterized protein n=1 Tax=Yinghuangia aomiensis TaxID=676205 RepID=A0ABP9HTT1_9ACTN